MSRKHLEPYIKIAIVVILRLYLSLYGLAIEINQFCDSHSLIFRKKYLVLQVSLKVSPKYYMFTVQVYFTVLLTAILAKTYTVNPRFTGPLGGNG